MLCYFGTVILAINNCNISGATAYRSGGYNAWVVTPSKPAVNIVNCKDKNIFMQNSILSCPNSIDSTTKEGCTLTIQNCTNLRIDLDKTTIYGVDSGNFDSKGIIFCPPRAGLLIQDSTDITMSLAQSSIIGGKGYSAFPPISYYNFWILPPNNGAPGGILDHASVKFNKGLIGGGAGGDGGNIEIFDPGTFEKTGKTTFVDGACDGAALLAENSSSIIINNATLQPGLGGLPNGQTGKQYEIDETSSIRLLPETKVECWALYQ